MRYLNITVGWLLVMLCAVPVIDYANPVVGVQEIRLNRDGTYYMELTNKGLVSLQDSINLFETMDGRQFKATFSMNTFQIWAPTDYRRAEGRRFQARVEMAAGILPVVTLLRSSE